MAAGYPVADRELALHGDVALLTSLMTPEAVRHPCGAFPCASLGDLARASIWREVISSISSIFSIGVGPACRKDNWALEGSMLAIFSMMSDGPGSSAMLIRRLFVFFVVQVSEQSLAVEQYGEPSSGARR